jgi:hypothetical protein
MHGVRILAEARRYATLPHSVTRVGSAELLLPDESRELPRGVRNVRGRVLVLVPEYR